MTDATALALAERLKAYLEWSGWYGTAPEPTSYEGFVNPYPRANLTEANTVVQILAAALDAVRRETIGSVLRYQQMRIVMSDQSRQVEVLAGNLIKEAIENGAIAELRGLEIWCRAQAEGVGDE